MDRQAGGRVDQAGSVNVGRAERGGEIEDRSTRGEDGSLPGRLRD